MAAAEVTIGTGAATSNLSGWSVIEAATPLDPADSTGEVGHFTAVLPEDEAGRQVIGKKATLTTDGGAAAGPITDASSDGTDVTLTADTSLGVLNVIRRAAPYNGTLGGALAAYGALVGLTITVDPSVASRPVTLPGWNANVWVMLKMLCAVQKIEVAPAGTGAVARPVRTRAASLDFVAQDGWAIGNSGLAQFIEAYNYNTTYKTNALAYPPGAWDDETGATTPAGWTTEVPIIQVGAYQTVELEVPVNASLTSVQQPVCKSWVGQYDNTASVYTVMGNDGVRALDPAVWTSRGGSVTVKIGEDTSTLIITVNSGRNEPSLAPYRIAMSSGNDYSSLRIVGTGVFTSRTRYRIPTGVPASLTSTEVGVTIDTPLIGTLSQMYDAVAAAQPRVAAPFKTLSAATADAGQKVGDVAGARVDGGDTMYRVRSATTTAEGVGWSADQDTLFSDHNARWAGKKFSDWNAVWADGTKTWRDYAAAPLALQ